MEKYFSVDQVKDLIWDCEIDRKNGENRRWSRNVTSIVEDEDGKCYAINWQEGLTEYQENEYFAGNYNQVEKFKKMVEIEVWEEVVCNE